MSTQTPTGRLRAYYKNAWGIDTTKPRPGPVARTLRGLGRLLPQGPRLRGRPISGLGLVELSNVTAVGIVVGAVATYLWLYPPKAFRPSKSPSA
jgi:hypothetical protein